MKITMRKIKLGWKYRRILWKYRGVIRHRREIAGAAAAALAGAAFMLHRRPHTEA